jgi:hypothetical protein
MARRSSRRRGSAATSSSRSANGPLGVSTRATARAARLAAAAVAASAADDDDNDNDDNDNGDIANYYPAAALLPTDSTRRLHSLASRLSLPSAALKLALPMEH